MASKRKFIDGIHNYCDRWCERCPMTAHCRVFATEQVYKKHADTLEHDKKNVAFWTELREAMGLASDEIEEDAREQGYDFELTFEADEENEFKAEPVQWKPRRPRRTKIPTLSASAHEYMNRVMAFLEKHQDETEDSAAVRRWLEMKKAAGVRPAQDAARVADAIEVIRWYHMLMAVKLDRALKTHEREEEELDPDDMDTETREYVEQFERDDADGSAKVVLIGIDRSIQAWAVVHQKLPHLAGAALENLECLTDLRDRVQSSFPNARRFKRPGFAD